MTPRTLKNYYVVMFDTGNVATWSIAWRKKDCRDNYLNGIGHHATDLAEWEKAQKRGHKIVKVNIYFEVITPATTPEKEEK